MKTNAKVLYIISGVFMILGFCLNINDFIMGSTPKVGAFCISTLFTASCYCLCFMKKGRKTSFAFITYTGFIAIISLAAFIVGTYRLSADYLIPFVLIAMPPFYGLSLFTDGALFYSITFVLSSLAFIANVYVSLKKKASNK